MLLPRASSGGALCSSSYASVRQFESQTPAIYPPLMIHRHPMCADKAVKRKAKFEESKKFKERLQAFRKEAAEISQEKNVV